MSEINIILKASDQASAEIAAAGNKISESMQNVERSSQGVAEAQKNVDASAKSLVLGFSGLATSSFSLFESFDRIEKSQVAVDRANLQVKTSAKAAEDAQDKYNEAMQKYGASSEKAKDAAQALALAEEKHQVAVERAEIAQGNMNEAMARSALQVIPTAITMIGSISMLSQNWAAVTQVATGAQAALNAVMNANPILLVITAIGIIVGALAALYATCKPVRDALNAIGQTLYNFFKPAIDAVVGALAWLWNNVLVPLGNFLSGVFGGIIKALGDAFNWLAGAVKPVADALGAVANAVGGAWNWLTSTIGGAVNAIGGAFSSLTGFTEDTAEAVTRATQDTVEQSNRAMGQMAVGIESIQSSVPIFGGALGAMKDAVLGFTGQTEAYYTAWRDESIRIVTDNLTKQETEINTKYTEQCAAIDKALTEQVATITTKYDEMTKAVEAQYKTDMENYVAYWDSKYTETTTELDTVTSKITSHYDEELRTCQDGYQKQIDAVNQYYDDLQAATDANLAAIRDKRKADLDDLELNMLQQKTALEKSYADGKIDKDTYEKAMSDLQKTYNESRNKMSDDYRLQELTQEQKGRTESEKIESDREKALTDIKNKEKTDVTTIENAKNTDLTKAGNDFNALVQKRANDLKTIETNKANDIKAAEIKAAQEKADALAKKEADINAALTKSEADKAKIMEDTAKKINDSQGSWWSNIGGTISGGLSSIGGAISDWASGAYKSIVDTFSSIGKSITDALSGAGSAISNAIGGAANAVGGAMGNVASSVGGALSGAGSAISSFIGSVCFAHALDRASKSSIITMAGWVSMVKNSMTTGLAAIKDFNREVSLTELPVLSTVLANPSLSMPNVLPSPAGPVEQSFTFAPNISVSTGPVNGTQSIKDIADTLYDELHKRVRNEMKSKTFFTGR